MMLFRGFIVTGVSSTGDLCDGLEQSFTAVGCKKGSRVAMYCPARSRTQSFHEVCKRRLALKYLSVTEQEYCL